MEIKRVGTRVVYKNRWMSLVEDETERPSGARGIYSFVDKPDFVIVMPFEDGYVHLVEQYRYPVKKRCVEFPQGTWEDDPQADPEKLAVGELSEETGLIAGKMVYAGHLYLAPGLSTQGYHVYLATDLVQGEKNPDPEEEGLTTTRVKIEEFEEMIVEGTIKDPSTISAYTLIKMKGLLENL